MALLAHTCARSTNNTSVTTTPIDTTGATLLLLTVTSYSGGGSAITPTDSAGNTWIGLNTNSPITTRCRIWYCASPITSPTHTFSGSTTTTYPCIAAAAFSGTTATPLNSAQSGAHHNGTGNTLSTGGMTPDVPNAIVYTGFGGNATGATFSIDSGYTLLGQQPPTASESQGIAHAYKIQTGSNPTSTNPMWTASVTSDMTTRIAAFSPSAVVTSIGGEMTDEEE